MNEVFRKDLNIWLVRDAVFGLLDLANIHMLLGRDSESTLRFEDLFSLIEPMIMNRPGQQALSPDKRQRILRAIVGTYGGGTGLATQKEYLELLGCHGTGNVRKFTEIVAGTVLCGEISLASAVMAGDWVSSHDKYGRNR